MKKIFLIGVVVGIFILNGCGSYIDMIENRIGDYGHEIGKTDASNTEGDKEESKIVWESNTLDVDGNAIADYAVVEILSEENVYSNILTVIVDSGMTYKMRYNGSTTFKEDFITVKTGKLHFLNKDSIVIEITNSTSNYGSTDIHILSIIENEGKAELVEELAILDGMTESENYYLYEKELLMLDISNITGTAEDELIQYNDELGKYVVQISEYENSEKIYLYWDEDEWKIN